MGSALINGSAAWRRIKKGRREKREEKGKSRGIRAEPGGQGRAAIEGRRKADF